ncbi:hypothetical protein NC653_026534 [Populus alba x Populus x berolinensis]|uniref:Uncharacterized protein n=1 Tax=Populus alba x Populus x berolinensis TaxID=444605 RepID=A0AAD6MDY6_9ROSI|nr:hypothetical protein NC653_026534 [Populus alba x Populus x berolinensis]
MLRSSFAKPLPTRQSLCPLSLFQEFKDFKKGVEILTIFLLRISLSLFTMPPNNSDNLLKMFLKRCVILIAVLPFVFLRTCSYLGHLIQVACSIFLGLSVVGWVCCL